MPTNAFIILPYSLVRYAWLRMQAIYYSRAELGHHTTAIRLVADSPTNHACQHIHHHTFVHFISFIIFAIPQYAFCLYNGTAKLISLQTADIPSLISTNCNSRMSITLNVLIIKTALK